MKRILFVALLAVAALGLAGTAMAQTNSHAPRPYYVSPDQPEQGVPPDVPATASDDPNSPVQGGSGTTATPPPAGTTDTPGTTTGTTGSPDTYGTTSGSTSATTPDPDNPDNPDKADRKADKLPATAGAMPLIALIGVLAAGLFFALRLFRTRPIDFRG